MHDCARLADAATPGPWAVEMVGELGEKSAVIPGVLRERYGDNSLDFGEDHATAYFVAAAREAVPALQARVDELTETLAQVVQQRNDIARDRREMPAIIAGLTKELEEAIPGRLRDLVSEFAGQSADPDHEFTFDGCGVQSYSAAPVMREVATIMGWDDLYQQMAGES